MESGLINMLYARPCAGICHFESTFHADQNDIYQHFVHFFEVHSADPMNGILASIFPIKRIEGTGERRKKGSPATSIVALLPWSGRIARFG